MMGPFKLYILMTIVVITTSCSTIKTFFVGEETLFEKLKFPDSYVSRDYRDQLIALVGDYVKTPGVKVRELRERESRYLNLVYNIIVSNNELIFDRSIKPHFYILKEERPYYFSLPPSNIFLSTGLIRKYLKNESVLVSVLAYEMLKSHKGIYNKKKHVPLGFVKTEDMLSFIKIKLKHKAEMNRWVFYVLNRAGFDGLSYLRWIQMQNRNSLEFVWLYGNTQSLSREEYFFKNFIAKEQLLDKGVFQVQEKNSSDDFYRFINSVKRIKI